jgi:hypothetical protein
MGEFESSYLIRMLDVNNANSQHTVFVPTYTEMMALVCNLKEGFVIFNVDTLGAIVETDTKQFMRIFEGEKGVVA